VLHHLKVVVKSRLLCAEELDLIEFLVAQVTSLSSSLACKATTVELSTPPPVAPEVVILQTDLVVPSANPHAVGDTSAAVVGLLTLPLVALELHAISIEESFKVKPPDIATLEVGHKC
jgi:hypothetical protein